MVWKQKEGTKTCWSRAHAKGACIAFSSLKRPFKNEESSKSHLSVAHLYQRAENGALDPWSLDLRLGRPRFLPQIALKPFKIRILGPLDWKSGRPKNADSTTTDPTPHSRPSDSKNPSRRGVNGSCVNSISGVWLVNIAHLIDERVEGGSLSDWGWFTSCDAETSSVVSHINNPPFCFTSATPWRITPTLQQILCLCIWTVASPSPPPALQLFGTCCETWRAFKRLWQPILHPRRPEEGWDSSMADAVSSPAHRPCDP